jgi:hypothetical protein
MRALRPLILAVVCLSLPLAARAQTPAPTTPAPADDSDPDARVDALQPDFNLVALPTTLRMPVHKWAFRVTHRFTRPLGQGDFGDLASDLFGLDSAAQVGLELRYGLAKGTQVGVHRTSERTIQVFGQHTILNERGGAPAGLDVIATLEGGNNLKQRYESALGLVFSKYVVRRASVYAEPIYVFNTSPASNAGSDNNTFMVGLGARVRVRPAMYLTAEVTPRLAGFDPGAHQTSFGLEGRAGGHLFQLNVGNGFGTTLGQIAANGAFNYDNWYIGFNIARKFF